MCKADRSLRSAQMRKESLPCTNFPSRMKPTQFAVAGHLEGSVRPLLSDDRFVTEGTQEGSDLTLNSLAVVAFDGGEAAGSVGA